MVGEIVGAAVTGNLRMPHLLVFIVLMLASLLLAVVGEVIESVFQQRKVAVATILMVGGRQ